ncbi:MAG TPA: hypothetical protein VET24_16970, partial [Actinomycetota bacterium]|nr:hypothetical protein [Actinomycetota bacterium]
MATAAEQLGASCNTAAGSAAGELWRLILRAWCGSSLEAVCGRVGQFCGLPRTEIESTVLGLMNDSITTLPPEVVEAFQRALGSPAGAPTERRNHDMPRTLNVKATLTPDREAPPVEAEPILRGPFPCEEEDCDRGFDTAQGLRMHRRRGHEHKGGNGWPSPPAGKPDPLNQRQVKILSAAERSEDPETEAVAVCARHLTRLTEPEVKRVLE